MYGIMQGTTMGVIKGVTRSFGNGSFREKVVSRGLSTVEAHGQLVQTSGPQPWILILKLNFFFWVAIQEFKLSYHDTETLLVNIYPYFAKLK